MKKLGFCLLALCLVGYVAGCGTEDTPPAEPTTPPVTEPGDAGDVDPGTEDETDADPPA